MGYTDPITAWKQNAKGRGIKNPLNQNADQAQVATYDKPTQDALSAIASQQLAQRQTALATQTGDIAANQAGELTPYGYNSDTSGLQQAAQNNPFQAQLALAAGAQQPYAAQQNAAAGLSAAGGNVAAALGGPGSFAGATQTALGQFGDQVGQFNTDTNMLRDTAAGRGPSAAAALAQSQLDSNARNMVATAAGARGGNIAAGLRTALTAGAAQVLQGSQQISAMRAQEQLNAQQGLTQANTALSGARANIAGATTAASTAESQRQAAASAAANGATTAATGVANSQVAGQGQVLDALAQGGNMYNNGVNAATSAYSAGGNVAAAQAASLEDQKKRALAAAQMFANANAQTQSNNSANKNAKISAGAQTDISPGQVVGGLFSAGGQALGMAAGK